MKHETKYPGFFDEAQKCMSKDSIMQAEQKAEQILLNARLAELRKEAGLTQEEVEGYRQSSISKIEGGKDLKISTLVAYCKALGMGVEINAYPIGSEKKARKRTLLRTS